MVIGGGVVGQNAAEIAIGMGAETYVSTATSTACASSRSLLNGRCSTVLRLDARDRAAPAGHADLVIGAVLIHGAGAAGGHAARSSG